MNNLTFFMYRYQVVKDEFWFFHTIPNFYDAGMYDKKANLFT